MALQIKELIIISIAVILLIAAILLIKYESRLKETLSRKKNNRNIFYRNKLKAVRASNPEQALGKIDKLAREFFSEAFGPDYHAECSEIMEKFTKDNNKDCASFCSMLIDLNYAGENSSREKVRKLTSLLAKIISENKIPFKV
jgi:hypothetical protein